MTDNGRPVLAPAVVLVLLGLLAGCSAVEQPASELPSPARAVPGETPLPADHPGQAIALFLAQRLPPGASDSDYPIEHLQAVREELLSNERQLRREKGQVPMAGGIKGWQALGPGNIGGRTRAIAIHPDDPQVLWAGGVAGGIWKSTDSGASWRPIDDLMPNLAITTIVVDTGDPRILYAGTGEGLLGNADSNFVRGLGIFTSSDGGETWRQLSGTVDGTVPEGAFWYVNDLAISPNDSRCLYAATQSGVWRSTDAGETWTVLLANQRFFSQLQPQQPAAGNTLVGCTELAVRTDTAPDVLLAAFGSLAADGLYRSPDGGETWQLVLTAAGQGRISLALTPSDNDVMYACMAGNIDNSFGQLVNVYRSDDGGATWQGRVDLDSHLGPWLLSNTFLATGCIDSFPAYSQGWYDNVIAVDPADPDIVWVGGIDLLRSDDGARTFGLAAYGFSGSGSSVVAAQSIHADQHAVVFDPGYNGTTNQRMYVGSDGGIARTDNARAAVSQEECPFPGDTPLPEVTWHNLNNGYAVTQFYHGDSARDADIFLGGTQDNGNVMVTSATPDAWSMITGSDGGSVAIDPTDPRTIYVEIVGFPAIYKSSDGGRTFADANQGITDNTSDFVLVPFTMDPADASTLWTGHQRPWRTTDGAGSWQVAGPTFWHRTRGQRFITALAVAPSSSEVIYLGLHTGQVAVTRNGLAPDPVWTESSGSLPNGWVSSLAVDPADPAVAYVTYSTYGIGHVFRTTDGGQTWQPLDGIAATGIPDIPVHWLVVRPCRSQQLYAGTELGVFASDDGGTTWLPANIGLAHTVVESLDFQDEHTLVAFTHGRGAFRARLEPCPGRAPRRPGGRRPAGSG